MAKLSVCSAILLTLGLAGCATTVPTPPAVAVLSIEGKTCTDTPSLATTISLTPPKRPAPTLLENTHVSATSQCVKKGGKPSNYVVYALPASPQNHTITVGGQKESLRAFAPSISILDANGTVLRDFPKDRLTNFGSAFAVQFRPSEQARYILVQSDPELVGTVMSAFETNILSSTTYTYNPYSYTSGSYQTQVGKEGGTNRAFSHEGIVSVYVQAVSGKIGLPDAK
jgi:hypothetical protein